MSLVLLPAKGSAGFRNILAAATDFMALGPFAKGHILRRVTVTAGGSGEAGPPPLNFSLAVCGGPGLSQANFGSGISLIDFSDNIDAGDLMVLLGPIQSFYARYEFFPGWVFGTGAQWLLVKAGNAGAVLAQQVFVSCEVWRLARFSEQGMRAEEPS